MLLDWAWNIILSQKTHLGDGFRSRNRFLGAYMWCCSECFQFPILGNVFCRQCPDPGLPLLGWNSSAHSAGEPHWPSKSHKSWAQEPPEPPPVSPLYKELICCWTCQPRNLSCRSFYVSESCCCCSSLENISIIVFMELPLNEKSSQSSKKLFETKFS